MNKCTSDVLLYHLIFSYLLNFFESFVNFFEFNTELVRFFLDPRKCSKSSGQLKLNDNIFQDHNEYWWRLPKNSEALWMSSIFAFYTNFDVLYARILAIIWFTSIFQKMSKLWWFRLFAFIFWANRIFTCKFYFVKISLNFGTKEVQNVFEDVFWFDWIFLIFYEILQFEIKK